MKCIAVIGANDFQNRLILRSQQMGYFVHAFAWQCGDIGEKTADCFHPISITEKERILRECQAVGVCGVCSIASDLAVTTVNYVAEGLGLPCNPTSVSSICTNKFEMRGALMGAGLPVPRYARVGAGVGCSPSCFDGFSYPLIVKPTDRSGSRGVTLVKSDSQIESAVESAVAQSFEKCAIVEEYITGDEYSCEGVSFGGEHFLLAFTKKHTTDAPHFIETGHDQPSDLTDEQRARFTPVICRALDALGIRFGASHSEFRVTPSGELRIIEIGARMGGDCIGSDLVPLSTGYDYVRMVIDCAVGNAPDFSPICAPQRAHIRFLFTNDDVIELRRRMDAGFAPYRVYISPEADDEHQRRCVTDSSTRLGYYIFCEEL